MRNISEFAAPVVTTCALVLGVNHTIWAGPMPLDLRTDGLLVADLTRDAVYYTRDLNADGVATGAGEVSIYFDENNASGLASPTNSVFSVFQSETGHIYIGDGTSDSVYRLSDFNADGDAQDAGEARVWFSEANMGGFTLPTPNSVYEGPDNALYIVNAGVSSRPTDAVYRTIDLNNDGDANDAGEASVWLDLSNLASAVLGGGVPINRSSAFDITFIGDTAYIADTVGGEPDTVFRAHDANFNGQIDAGELNVFIDDNNLFGVPVATGLVSNQQDSLFILESSSSADQTLYRLQDEDASGAIDDVGEAVEVWNEAQVGALGVQLGSAFSLAIGPNGEISVVSGGADLSDNVFRLVDQNGDGDFLDAGETLLWAAGNGSGVFADFARTAEYISVVAPVPLPAPALLLCTGLACLCRSLRRAKA
ncbi:MAG: hypothetical protein AAF387_14885 [Pseudomonadota bacterium]